MNEKIKELAEQAEKYANEQAHRAWHHSSGFNPFKEKFAELIVRDCVAQCDKNKDHEWLGAGSKVSAFNIKQHFGVEE